MNEVIKLLTVWSCLLMSIFSGAVIGPMFKYMQNAGIRPILGASWRCQCMLFFLIPLSFLEYCLGWRAKSPSVSVYGYTFLAGLAWTGVLLFWIVSLKWTSTVHAALVADIHPLLLAIYFQLVGLSISRLENIGILVAISGIVICSLRSLMNDASASAQSGDGKNRHSGLHSLLGDALCFIAAGCQVMLFLLRKKVKDSLPLLQYTALTTVVIAVVSSVMSILFERDDYGGYIGVFCTSSTCLLGWTSRKWLEKMIMFAFVVGVICVTGFNYAMLHISPLLISSVCLLDPVVTGLISWVTGLEGLPDIYTWVGGAVILFGIFLVSYGEHIREPESESAIVITSPPIESEELESDDSLSEKSRCLSLMQKDEGGEEEERRRDVGCSTIHATDSETSSTVSLNQDPHLPHLWDEEGEGFDVGGGRRLEPSSKSYTASVASTQGTEDANISILHGIKNFFRSILTYVTPAAAGHRVVRTQGYVLANTEAPNSN